MGRPTANMSGGLSAGPESQGVSGSFRSSIVAAQSKVSARPSAESGRIVRHDFRSDAPLTGVDATVSAKMLVEAAFPGGSENEICEAVASALDTSPNTIRRILRKETKDASWRLVSACLVICMARGKHPAQVIGSQRLAQIMQGMGDLA